MKLGMLMISRTSPGWSSPPQVRVTGPSSHPSWARASSLPSCLHPFSYRPCQQLWQREQHRLLLIQPWPVPWWWAIVMISCTSCTCLPLSLSMTALTWAASTGLPVALRIAVRDSSSELWRFKYLAPCPRVWPGCRLRDTACFVVQIIYIII